MIFGSPGPLNDFFCVALRCRHGKFSSLLNPFRGLCSNYRLTTVTLNRAKEKRKRLHANVRAIFLSSTSYLKEVMTTYDITVVAPVRYRGPVLGSTKNQNTHAGFVWDYA